MPNFSVYPNMNSSIELGNKHWLMIYHHSEHHSMNLDYYLVHVRYTIKKMFNIHLFFGPRMGGGYIILTLICFFVNIFCSAFMIIKCFPILCVLELIIKNSSLLLLFTYINGQNNNGISSSYINILINRTVYMSFPAGD